MYSHRQLFHQQAPAGRFDRGIGIIFALFIFLPLTPAAFAQTAAHVTHPDQGTVDDVNSDYTTEVQTAIATQPLAAQSAVRDRLPDNGFSKNGPWNTKLPPNVPLAPNSAAMWRASRRTSRTPTAPGS